MSIVQVAEQASTTERDRPAINTIRALSIDAVARAKCEHTEHPRRLPTQQP